MKVSVYIAASVDGFVAREDGSTDWLSVDDAGDGEDYGYKAFIASVDALLMGRNTFEKVMGFGAWPYDDTPVFVLSSRPLEFPDALSGKVTTLSASPREVVKQLAGWGVKHLYIDGGQMIQGFLREGLVQRLIVTRVPVLLGAGSPLFGPLSRDVKLRYVGTRAFNSGLVQTEYEVRA